MAEEWGWPGPLRHDGVVGTLSQAMPKESGEEKDGRYRVI